MPKANYELKEEAADDLRRIFRYGYETFGEAKAEEYFQALLVRFQQLAEQPLLFPSAENVGDGLRRSVCGKETIYYTITDAGVNIEAIISRQDIRRRISKP